MDRRTTERTRLSLEVDHILGETDEAKCVCSDISREGMRLTLLEGESWGSPRHAWLSFRLPGDDGEEIRALGELRYETSDADVRGFRFKYIYPSARRRLEAFLEAS